MNKQKTSLVSELTLWRIYRRMLFAGMLAERTAPARGFVRNAAVAAAIAECRWPGDLLGLAAADAQARFVWGLPVDTLSEHPLTQRAARRSAAGTTEAGDTVAKSGLGLLPGAGAEQAGYAVGAAVGMHAQATKSMVVLLDAQARARSGADLSEQWAEASEKAVAMRLPLVFVSESRDGLFAEAADPGKPAPKLPSIPVSRHDAIAIYRVLYESAARARTGGGPTWIDCRDTDAACGLSHAMAMLEKAMRARGIFRREDVEATRKLQRRVSKHLAKAW